MDLERYFERIGFRGPARLDLETLVAIHRCHLLAIPYENLDIHLGRRLVLDQSRSYEKLVLQRRGGWCYEMNGLLALALQRIGFRVTLASGTVGRGARGNVAEGNHLVVLVHLDQPYLADVGFGDGLLEPVPLVPGPIHQAGFQFTLDRTGDRWRFTNHPFGAAAEFDFTVAPCRLDAFTAKCHELQTSPESSFVKTIVCQRYRPGGIVTLRGAIRRWVSPSGVSEVMLKDAHEFQQALEADFGLFLVDEVEPLWAKVEERHRRWVAESEAGS